MTVAALLSSVTSFPYVPIDKVAPPTAPPSLQPETDSYLLYQPQIPLNFQLPKEDQSSVAFLAPEPATYLVAPQETQEPNYYQVPIPAQDLVAPTEIEWNPKRDPKFYYEVPAVLSQQELPTKEYPKKYNENIHSKIKPFASKPKHELVLEPINENQYEDKQRKLEKTFQQLAKKQNQKEVENVKVQSTKNTKIPPIVFKPLNKSVVSKSPNQPESVNEPVASSSGFVDHVPAETFNRGLSGQITASLGIPHSPHAGERLIFHVVGHDGPHSYKWGYDTGKG